jgi:hypothetical protein
MAAIALNPPAVETDRDVAAPKLHDSDGGDRRGDENQRAGVTIMLNKVPTRD